MYGSVQKHYRIDGFLRFRAVEKRRTHELFQTQKGGAEQCTGAGPEIGDQGQRDVEEFVSDTGPYQYDVEDVDR